MFTGDTQYTRRSAAVNSLAWRTTQVMPNLCPRNSVTWLQVSSSHTRTAGWWPLCRQIQRRSGQVRLNSTAPHSSVKGQIYLLWSINRDKCKSTHARQTVSSTCIWENCHHVFIPIISFFIHTQEISIMLLHAIAWLVIKKLSWLCNNFHHVETKRLHYAVTAYN